MRFPLLALALMMFLTVPAKAGIPYVLQFPNGDVPGTNQFTNTANKFFGNGGGITNVGALSNTVNTANTPNALTDNGSIMELRASGTGGAGFLEFADNTGFFWASLFGQPLNSPQRPNSGVVLQMLSTASQVQSVDFSGSSANIHDIRPAANSLDNNCPLPMMDYNSFYDPSNFILRAGPLSTSPSTVLMSNAVNRWVTNGLMAAWTQTNNNGRTLGPVFFITDGWNNTNNAADGSLVINSNFFPNGFTDVIPIIKTNGGRPGIYTAFAPLTCGGVGGTIFANVLQHIIQFDNFNMEALELDSCGDDLTWGYERGRLYRFAEAILEMNEPRWGQLNTNFHPAILESLNMDVVGGVTDPSDFSACNESIEAGPGQTVYTSLISELFTLAHRRAKLLPYVLRRGHYVNLTSIDPLVQVPVINTNMVMSCFVMDCLFQSGIDIGAFDPQSIYVLKNPELIAIDWDPGFVPCYVVGGSLTNNTTEVWVKPLGSANGNTKAVVLKNDANSTAAVGFTSDQIGIPTNWNFTVRDALHQTNVGVFSGTFTNTVGTNTVNCFTIIGTPPLTFSGFAESSYPGYFLDFDVSRTNALTGQGIGFLADYASGLGLGTNAGIASPIYHKDPTQIGGNAYVAFDGATMGMTNSFASVPQPYTIFMVSTYPLSGTVLFANTGGTVVLFASGTSITMSAGTSQSYTASTNIWYITEIYVNGASSVVKTNYGTAISANLGATAFQNLGVGANFTGTQNSQYNLSRWIMYTNTTAGWLATYERPILDGLNNRFKVSDTPQLTGSGGSLTFQQVQGTNGASLYFSSNNTAAAGSLFSDAVGGVLYIRSNSAWYKVGVSATPGR